ncbi:helix-turn-helix transcriptional regulator [Streptomyces sp. NPDC048558]|uniref:helix-turn-helix transcriptional regulator n=1 Tax=Streptomyces sp. NPDC048558 TaxID=3155759 RepID=UPI00341B2C3F
MSHFSPHRLKAVRMEHGLSRFKAANAFGVSEGTVLYYELGKCTPSVKSLCRIADYFGVGVEEFFDRDDGHADAA